LTFSGVHQPGLGRQARLSSGSNSGAGSPTTSGPAHLLPLHANGTSNGSHGSGVVVGGTVSGEVGVTVTAHSPGSAGSVPGPTDQRCKRTAISAEPASITCMQVAAPKKYPKNYA
jgi:hypothetical protein